MKTRTTLASIAASGVLALTAAGCGDSSAAGDSADAAEPTTSAPARAAGTADQAAELTVQDPWVKAADSGMTAAFGTLVNSGTDDVVVTSATSDITSAMELHETVENADGSMAMQPKQGGFTVPAGGEHELAPGGDHLMIMNLTRPIQPGEDVTITLTFADGSTQDLTATVKNFTGADEQYQNGDMDMDMDSSEGSGGM
jgi:periplasmic copper chaperone A